MVVMKMNKIIIYLENEVKRIIMNEKIEDQEVIDVL